MRTKQEVFDTVSRHLLTQMGRCEIMTNAGTAVCQYHGDDGRACAIGCMIPAGVSTDAIEGVPVRLLALEFPEFMRDHMEVEPKDEEMLELMVALQGTHDLVPTPCWAEDLETIADNFHLVFKPQTE